MDTLQITRNIDKKGSIPIKEQLGSWIIDQINRGILAPGSKIPSINQLAQDYKIARETIRISLDTLVQRGFLIPEHGKGYFVTSREKQMLRIGIIGRIDGVYMRPFYEGLTAKLGERASVFIADSHRSMAATRVLIENMAYQQSVDRLVVIPLRGKENLLHKMLNPFRRYMKIAWIDRAPAHCRDATFTINYGECVTHAMEYFVKYDILQILYFGRNPEDNSVFSSMRSAYRAFRKTQGHDQVIFNNVKKIDQLRHKKGRVGVLCETDMDALELHSFCLSRGIKIPTEISLISFDNSDLTEVPTPKITSIDPGFRKIGRCVATWALIDATESTDKPVSYFSKPQLVIKGSTRNNAI